MKEMLRKALSLQEDRMEVVPNGVNLGLVDESIHRYKRKYRKLRELGDTIIMYVGSLEAVEGVDILIRAMARMRIARQNAALVVAGSGTQRSSLIRLARSLGVNKQVYFVGWVPYQELFGFQSNADVLVAPLRHGRTRYDTAQIAFPAKIPNYLAVGKPVVATNVGDIPLVLEDDREALIVEQGSVDGLANALQRLSSDTGLRKKLGKNAQIKAKDFDWKNLAARIKRLYSNLQRS
jgi:glycosyltransferase involved in cell wall biosynthesis